MDDRGGDHVQPAGPAPLSDAEDLDLPPRVPTDLVEMDRLVVLMGVIARGKTAAFGEIGSGLEVLRLEGLQHAGIGELVVILSIHTLGETQVVLQDPQGFLGDHRYG